MAETPEWLKFEFYLAGTVLLEQGTQTGRLVVLRDGEIEVLRDGEGLSTRRALKVEKVKDGRAEGREFGFRLVELQLGTDEDGDPITSCVVEPADGQVPLKGAAKRLGHVEAAVMSTVRELNDLAGPVPMRTVLDRYATEVAGDDEEERKKAKDSARRAVGNLVKAGKLAPRDGAYALSR